MLPIAKVTPPAYYVAWKIYGGVIMCDFKIGDIVGRRSYGGDIAFTITDISSDDRGHARYILRGLLYRIEADCSDGDLVKLDKRYVNMNMQRYLSRVRNKSFRNLTETFGPHLYRLRGKPGSILHIDSSKDFMDRCLEYYKDGGIKSIGRVVPESEQPYAVKGLIEANRPEILVLTGHDSLKKDADKSNLSSYKSSKYYIQAVKEARKYQPDFDKLCIFAGACQSYFEAIMDAGANFGSSPGRILINALDPAIVSQKVALTNSRNFVTPSEVARITISGAKGIGGINTRGRLISS